MRIEDQYPTGELGAMWSRGVPPEPAERTGWYVDRKRGDEFATTGSAEYLDQQEALHRFRSEFDLADWQMDMIRAVMRLERPVVLIPRQYGRGG